MEGEAFASLAQIRILLLPVGSIRRATFDKWASLLRSFDHIRQGDIPPDSREDSNRFIPSQLSNGYIHLSYPSHPPPASHKPFSIFRPSLYPLGLIGVADASSSNSLSSIAQEFNSKSSDLFSPRSAFPLSRRCYVFEENGQNTPMPDVPESLVVIPSAMGNKKEYLSTLIAELCHDILAQFPSLVRTLESPQCLDVLNSALLPTFAMIPGPDGLALAVVTDSPPPSRDPPVKTNSLPPNGTQTTGTSSLPGSPPPGAKHSSMGRGTPPPLSFNRASSLTPTGGSKKRASTLGPAADSGRLAKFIGDLYLLAGRTSDAQYWFSEAIPMLKSQPDTIWHASALEAQCIIEVLNAWSAADGLNSSMSTASRSWSDISDKMVQVVNLYSRATSLSGFLSLSSPSSGESELQSLSFLYSESVLRHTNFLFSVWAAKGWGPVAFSTMLQPVLPPTLTPFSLSRVFHMTTLTSITRTQISNIASLAHGPFLLHLDHHDRIRILSSLASIYSCLGFRRKEVFILREVQATLMDLLLSAKDETQASAHWNALSSVNRKSSVTEEDDDGADGNESMLRMAKYICEVYGLDLTLVKLVKEDKAVAAEVDVDAGDVQSLAAKDALQLPFGWPELQVGVAREAIAITESLPSYLSVAQYSLAVLKSLHTYLTPSEQFHLYASSARALAAAMRFGDRRHVEYWVGKSVLGIEIVPPPTAQIPVPNRLSDFNPSLVPDLPTGRKGPFIYDPRLKSITTSQSIVVQNEPIEFLLTLWNPFMFDLEIKSVGLYTTGVPFKCTPIAVIVPANTYHIVPFYGTALEPGTLVIQGCNVQLPGGARRRFLLPIPPSHPRDKDGSILEDKRQSSPETALLKMKASGLDALGDWTRRQVDQKKRASGAPQEPKYLQCQVIPEQPLLRIRHSSLTHGALMLYDGETSTIRLTIENISSLSISFFKMTFDDSTMLPAQQALADGDISISEAYEIEYDLLHKPVFTWKQEVDEGQFVIEPGMKKVVVVNCLGKAACTSGNIRMFYSHSSATMAEQRQSTVFFSRQVVYPILVTVYHTLQCQSMNILPLLQGSGYPTVEGDVDSDVLRTALSEAGPNSSTGAWCLFSVDVMNLYGRPFEVTFSRKQEGVSEASTSRIIPPGSTSRIYLPIKRFSLPPSLTSSTIPTLSDRQFVVSKTHRTAAETATQHELFWYREELFKSIEGRWREPGATRFGELSLRQQRLSFPMLQALKSDSIHVELSMPSATEGRVVSLGSLFILRAQAINNTTIPLNLVLNYVNVPVEHFIYQGTLTNIDLGEVAPGGTVEKEVYVCFLVEGKFGLRASVRAAGIDPGLRGVGDISIIVKE